MDLLEIEIKAYCEDHAAIAAKLLARDARYAGTFTEKDLYLNHPCRNFKKTDEALRVRLAGDRIVLTYKGPKIGAASKTRLEKEVDLGDYGAILEILKHLGFREAGTIVKRREKYILNDIEICLDTVEDLGFFVELEKKGSERERSEQELFSLAEYLGLNRFERRSYLELKKAAI